MLWSFRKDFLEFFQARLDFCHIQFRPGVYFTEPQETKSEFEEHPQEITIMNKWLRVGAFVAALLSLIGAPALAHGQKDGSLTCRDNWHNDRLVVQCEMREQKMPAGGLLTVDASKNGGVSIHGWDQNEILVRARVQAAAASQGEADQLVKQIRVETSGDKVFAVGPENTKNYQWSVSYEIFVPKRSDLSLAAYNGGISIADVTGRIEFSGHNGGVVLKRVGGTVRGGTMNGGLVVELDGASWSGEELDVKTTNGGIDGDTGKLFRASPDRHGKRPSQHRFPRKSSGPARARAGG